MINSIIETKFLPFLQQKGVLSDKDVESILKIFSEKGAALASILSHEKYVQDSETEEFLSKELGIDVADPLEHEIDQSILDMVDKNIAVKYTVMPLDYDNGILSVAVINPMDIILIDDLRAVLSVNIRPFLALPHKIKAAHKKYYEHDESGSEQSIDIEEIMAEAAAEDVEVVENVVDSRITDIAQGMDETPVIKVTNLILMEGIKRWASDIFIEPWEINMGVRFRVDGLLEEMKAPPKSMAGAIVSRIKVMSNMDIAERRMPQDGRFKIKYQNRFVDFRVNVLPSSFGEKVCIRILDKSNQAQSLEKLGFDELELGRIRDAASKPHGMILVTGPTGSGKTTTLYSILAHIDSPEKNITTVEEPVEYQMYGINQVNINEQVGLTFAAALRSILRQDPDIIMVGEIRDFTTMDIAIKAALTGHLVLSTLHTNDACGSIVRITNMGIEPFLIASSVLMVSAQRLLRKLCANCKESYDEQELVLQNLGARFSGSKTFFKPVGCEVCRSTGYAGRTVITEVLPLTQTIKDLVMKKATAEAIKKAARLEGMTTLRECGVKKAIAGETSLEEVFRVTAPDTSLDAN